MSLPPVKLEPQIQETNTPKVAKGPSIGVFGCGGFGINTVRNIMAFLRHDDVSHVYIDTSSANLRTSEEALIVGTGDGSGKVRAANAEHVNQKITGASDKDLPAHDLSVVVFSLSGGTGSVVGPLVLREMHRRGSQCVAVCVADTGSLLDTQNTMKTLQTLQSIAKTNEIYLPLMMFDNESTRNTVDHVIHRRMHQFMNIMAARVVEIDKSDRLNWLNGHKTSQASAGLRLLHIASSGGEDAQYIAPGEIWDHTSDMVLDAVISVGTITKDGTVFFDRGDTMTRVVYEGTFVDPKIPPHIGLVMNGTQAMDSVMKRIQNRLENFKTFSRQAASVIPDADDLDVTGLVL